VTFRPVTPPPLQLDLVIVNETPVVLALNEAGLHQLACDVLAAERASGRWSVIVALVTDARLQALHRDYLGIDEPTDIMTFPADDPETSACGGELVVSVDHAVSRSAEWGLTTEGEIAFLVTHGLLHLLGWRDDSDEDRRRMISRQTELFNHWRESVIREQL
jgi:rRNA maturation RNase YbeY